jgi:uncharacterized protein (TIGR03032 family)
MSENDSSAMEVGGLNRFDRPIFIVSSPRAGSSLLFETLATSPSVWTLGGESHALFESFPALRPAARDYSSNRLLAEDATPEVSQGIRAAFLAQIKDREGQSPPEGQPLRLLEKTPKNALRIPFLRAIFPDARFVYLYRDPRETVSSMLDAWRSGRFVTYPHLPGWGTPAWSLALAPGWRDWVGHSLAEIVTRQWEAVTRFLLDDLDRLPANAWCVASYDQLVKEPQAEVARLCGFLDMAWDRPLTAPLPFSRHTLTSPEPDKWRHNAAELRPVMPLVLETAQRARELFARAPAITPAQKRSPAQTPVVPGEASAVPQDFSSRFTDSLPPIFNQLKFSLMVSTYQSGRVVCVRADGNTLNTHFRAFPSPMGMAVGRRGLAIGTLNSIWFYRNQPAVAAKVEPKGKHDACFLPTRNHITGDVRIHEMAFVNDELWFVATRFSCLATLDNECSFRPRWRPPFVTALSIDDRCHLNGMALRDGQIRYVTVLGMTDTRQGWRDNKAAGGCLLEVPSGNVVVQGLSMPHSPRWHAGRLWLLESGKGTLVTVDLNTGLVQTVAKLPGFTRGLAFMGPLAFIGLSKVRESVFDGIPVAREVKDRRCGVWVVDTRTGQTLGFLNFEGRVEEIFDVVCLPQIRYPELAEPDSDLVGTSFILPDEALKELAPSAPV